MNHPNIIVIDYKAPTYKTDSGAYDTYNMLNTLLTMSNKVTFISTQKYEQEPEVFSELRRAGVNILIFNEINFADWFEKQDFSGITHFFLYRPGVTYITLPIIKRKYPAAKILYFTVDLHHLRTYRQFKLTGDQPTRESAENYKQLELSLIAASDVSIVVSEYERDYLVKECSVNAAKIIYMPIYRPLIDSSNSFKDRNGVIFVGGFLHKPNVDGLNWFLQNIFPICLQLQGHIRFTVYGSNMPEHWRGLKIPQFEFMGFIDDLTEALNTARLAIAPLTYGAGIKGKVVQSVCSALPCVCTSVAAEGLDYSTSGLVVSDSPLGFAASVIACHENESFWNISKEKMLKYRENFSEEKFMAVLKSVV